MAENEVTPPPAPARRPLPLPAVAALIVLVVAGCALLGYAAFSAQAGEAAAGASPTPTLTASPPAVTAVPTFIPSETPTATETATTTPTETVTPSPTVNATPSRTPTATKKKSAGGAPAATPTASQTQPPSSASGGGGHGVVGQLSLCNPKSSYAAKSDTFQGERICVNELITNTTDQPISYGVLGVAAENISGGASGFQTSWRGDLSVPAHGNGPTGGGWQDGLYLGVGTYSLTLSICHSDVNTCLDSGGDWETLTSGIVVNVVNWTP
ncbi:MAG: hypothetical protein HY260_06945 [Chloroflexi bacterium]|nr:hypothetical protein [Chloroflexota bacterium]